MVLHKLHIAQRHTVAIRQCHAVARDDAAIGVVQIHTSRAARGDNHRFGLHCGGCAVLYVQTQHALQLSIRNQQIQRKMLVQTLNARILQ